MSGSAPHALPRTKRPALIRGPPSSSSGTSSSTTSSRTSSYSGKAGSDADPATRVQVAALPAIPAAPAAAVTRREFYGWGNLPPGDVLATCISGLYARVGVGELWEPVSEGEAMAMLNSVLDNDRNRPALMAANSQLCQVLLLAAVGARYLPDARAVDEHTQTSLFASGKWYLDIAFGLDVNDWQRLRANALVGLYLMLEKNFDSKDYFNRAIAIGQAQNLSDPISTASLREWQSLLFLNGLAASLWALSLPI